MDGVLPGPDVRKPPVREPHIGGFRLDRCQVASGTDRGFLDGSTGPALRPGVSGGLTAGDI